jgi:hypothetical protein
VFVHGKDTVVKLDSKDLSQYTNTSEISREADTHDVSAYGAEAHNYQGGLKDGTASMGGTYDNTAVTGPRAVVEPLVGSKVTFIRQPEGTGTGLPQDSVTVVVTSYVETAPVADMVTWTCEMQMSSVVDTTPQA